MEWSSIHWRAISIVKWVAEITDTMDDIDQQLNPSKLQTTGKKATNDVIN